MNLHSGSPFWRVKNSLFEHTDQLEKDLITEVLIIGSGITGALVAHELCNAGIECVVADKRAISGGSTVASTAQLQYEIDVPLYKLAKKIGEKKATSAYEASLQSIADIKVLVDDTGIKADFEYIPTLLLASNRIGLRRLKTEFEIRKKHNLPISFFTSEKLKQDYHIDGHGALWNNTSAQIDCYKTSTNLLAYHRKRHHLKLYAYTEIISYEKLEDGFIAKTQKGLTIRCKYLVIATGFEASRFLPKKIMKLISTYALVSQPLSPDQLWTDRCLIWETRQPYLYLRTTSDNRIMMGGEDIPFKNDRLRDAQMERKTKILERKFHRLFKDIPMVTDFTWCGTFSSTDDGLPYIGEFNEKNRFFALGYGGNGITFSMIAAQLIKNKILGKKDNRETLFGFDRTKGS
ncbi:FAD-dependent oxidoreductase [Olivibacter sp. CPCC 100613]|uniref:NAD(P)/FAD-dependent oxidoreductase n=1 Tax=Olivibacter sp. CPCC 100613 TaxID=3079931 RepID=UPI002FFC295F